MQRSPNLTGCVLLVLWVSGINSAYCEDNAVRFNADIRPILSEYCFSCHGPDAASREADLRLDQRESATASKAIVPGEPGKSELVARITSTDPDTVMPPASFRKRLKPEHKRLLTRWIEAGAAWQEHWAFIKPERSPVPNPPGAKTWAQNPIDHFLLEKLRELGLKPNPPEKKHTLARRAAFDITGLPPSEDMWQAFVNDPRDDAYTRYVDQQLKSQHAGEHRARYWLDAARYGDTHGMHVDNYREIWPYRDWVVGAFNANMPFDRFVIEQIAGDLLPDPTRDQRIATGFSRCNITTSEGGAIPAELDVRYMVDRVETTATVFLGLTAGCAVCHDHKYDPISQKEFYQLGAFFNNTTTPAMDGNQKDTPPVVTLPAAEFEEEWRDLQARRKHLRESLDRDPAAASRWWPERSREFSHPVSDDRLLVWLPLSEGEGETELPKNARWETEHPAGRRGVRFGEGGEFQREFPVVRTDEPLTISFWFRTPDRLMSTTVFDHTTTNNKKTSGWKITSSTQGALTFELMDGTGKKIRGLLPGEAALTPRAWQHVCVRYSGGQSNSSITILVNGEQRVLRNSTEDLIGAVELPAAPLKIAGRVPTAGLSDVRIFRRYATDEEVRLLANEFRLKDLLSRKTDWKDLSGEERELLSLYYRASVNESDQKNLHALAETQTRRDFIYSRSTTTLVMEELPTAPRAWVLERGEYDKRREEVRPNVPAVLPPLPKNTPANRLALAKWLVDRDNPLTARVMVNRLWQSVFGTGLVKTSEDFGVMGDRPSHPELLDWLAVEFMESGWNVNHILRLMLTSAAYQQSSAFTSLKLEKDPENRFLSRGPRMRLDAEALRDQALAVSGLLRRDIGGPSVKPYQPAGLWRVVAITGSNTRDFKRDTGDALYRRSLYTFWKRTAPPPSMAAFNAPTREQCTVRRERTNTPLQALVLMNDPQFMESARYLAEAVLKKSPEDPKRASQMLKVVLCRPPEKKEIEELLAVRNDFESIFNQNAKMAESLINTGDSKPDPDLQATELAAWTMAANTLLNRDDVINK